MKEHKTVAEMNDEWFERAMQGMTAGYDRVVPLGPCQRMLQDCRGRDYAVTVGGANGG